MPPETPAPQQQSPDPSTYRTLSAEAFKKALLGETVMSTLPNGTEEEWSALGENDWEDTAVIFDEVIIHEETLLEEEQVYPYLIEIRDCHFMQPFEIAGGTFEQAFCIYDGTFEKGFGILGGTFEKDFRIYGGTFELGFQIESGTFEQGFQIESGTFEEMFLIGGGIFQQGFQIESGTFEEMFLIGGGTFQQGFRISGGTFVQKCVINGGTFKDTLGITGGRIAGLRLSKAEFKQIHIGNDKGHIGFLLFTLPLRCAVHVEHSRIGFLGITQRMLKEGNLYLRDLSVQQIHIAQYVNEGTLIAQNVQIGFSLSKRPINSAKSTHPPRQIEERTEIDTATYLQMTGAEMGTCYFSDVDFEGFDNIIIKSSRLSDIRTTGKHFPLAEGKVFTDDKGNQEPAYMEETYNQLYGAMKRADANTMENRYYAEFQEWRRKRLKEEKIEPQNQATLWLNKWTTLYGQDWLRGLLLTIGLGLLFYGLICYFHWGWNIPDAPLSGINLAYHLGSFSSFMLPIHRADFFGKDMPLQGVALFVDFISRIVLGFMLYQVIAAFRRFGKR